MTEQTMTGRAMELHAKIYVAGHRGLVGSAIHQALLVQGYDNVVVRTRSELDLLDGPAVAQFFREEQPEYVFMAAAKVGGILANNTLPADFFRQNVVMQINVIDASRTAGVKRFLFLGSSCIYPRSAPQPMSESCLLTGPLEPTNRPYALAKIAGVEMCWSYNRQYGSNYVAVMPTNLYGPEDNFDLQSSHVLPALIRKMFEARCSGASEVVVWGSGNQQRELLHSADMAEACIFVMNLEEEKFRTLMPKDEPPLLNIGTGEDITIGDLARVVARETGFKGRIVFDTSKPDGAPRKLLDVSRIHGYGWHHRIGLEDGIRQTCTWYQNR